LAWFVVSKAVDNRSSGISRDLGLGLIGLLSIPMDTFNATTPILIMAMAAGHSVQIFPIVFAITYSHCC
jgi:hypothetical protein